MGERSAAEVAQLLRDVRRIDVQSRRLVSSVMAGSFRSVFRGEGIEFDEVREYVEGDDPRLVDWAVTARAGRLYVRRYVDERELELLFLVDLSPSMDAGVGELSARRVAARACATLAHSALKNHDKVGLIAFDRAVLRFLPPGRSARRLLSIVRDCLELRSPASSGPRTPGAGLAAALALAEAAVRRRALLFLVSDWLELPPSGTLARAARQHELIALRLSAPELDEPGRRLLRVRDPESGAEAIADFASPRVRAEFARRVAEARARVAAELRRSGVDLVELPVPRRAERDPVARPLLDFFRRRERRR